MKKLLLLVLLAFVAACNSCVPTPSPGPSPAPSPTPTPIPTVIVDAAPPPPDVDAAPAPAPAPAPLPGPQPTIDPGVRDACTKLAELHCAEGMAGCTTVMQRAIDARLTAIPLDCLVAAHTKADVHACGAFVACP